MMTSQPKIIGQPSVLINKGVRGYQKPGFKGVGPVKKPTIVPITPRYIPPIKVSTW